MSAAVAGVGELDFEVPGDVVDDGVGFGDVGVGGPAVGFELHALEADDGLGDGEPKLEGEGFR